MKLIGEVRWPRRLLLSILGTTASEGVRPTYPRDPRFTTFGYFSRLCVLERNVYCDIQRVITSSFLSEIPYREIPIVGPSGRFLPGL